LPGFRVNEDSDSYNEEKTAVFSKKWKQKKKLISSDWTEPELLLLNQISIGSPSRKRKFQSYLTGLNEEKIYYNNNNNYYIK